MPRAQSKAADTTLNTVSVRDRHWQPVDDIADDCSDVVELDTLTTRRAAVFRSICMGDGAMEYSVTIVYPGRDKCSNRSMSCIDCQ